MGVWGWGCQVTGYIPYDISADEMKSALESLSTIETVYVTRSTVDSNNGYTWFVTFATEVRVGCQGVLVGVGVRVGEKLHPLLPLPSVPRSLPIACQ